MPHSILGWILTDFFRQGLPRAAFNEAPMVEHAEPPVLPSAADHAADGAQVRQSASKAFPRAAVTATRHSCMSHMHVRVCLRGRLFLESKCSQTRRRWRVVWLSSRLDLDSMAEPQRQQLAGS